MQQKIILMGPILFLYHEESLVSSNLNSRLLFFHSVRPNESAISRLCYELADKLTMISKHCASPLRKKNECKLNNLSDLTAYPVENCIPKHAFEVEHVENRKKSNFTFLMHQNYSLNIMFLYRMSICVTEFAALGENLNTVKS